MKPMSPQDYRRIRRCILRKHKRELKILDIRYARANKGRDYIEHLQKAHAD